MLKSLPPHIMQHEKHFVLQNVKERAEFTRRKEPASLKILIKLDVYALSLSLLLRKIQLPPRGNVVNLRKKFRLCSVCYL